MKKVLSMLCVVLVVGFAGTAFAAKAEKVDVCHNGSVYTGDTSDNAVYDPSAWEPGSFVINISGNAVTKHEVNHGDLVHPDFSDGVDVTTEVTFGDDGPGNVVITGFETQQSCGPIPE
jgi:hypothetical protein